MIFIWILVGLALIVFALDRLVERTYRFERKSAQVTPQRYDIPFDEIQIPAKEGARLRGW